MIDKVFAAKGKVGWYSRKQNKFIMMKISCLGSWYPNFGRVVTFFDLSIDTWPWWEAHQPPRQIHTSCLWTMIDRTGPSDSHLRTIYLCCCVAPRLLWSLRLGLWPLESGTSKIVAKRGGSTTAVVIITLGLMTFGVWHEQISGKARG